MSVKRTSTHTLGNHTGKLPLVSVVVPTKNSAGTIEKCLKSILEQTYPKIEVVVVDGLSRDNTRKIADELKARIVTSPSKRSEARNMGAGLSKGDYLLFIDSDMELDPVVIAECMEMVDRGCDALIIPEISVGQGFWAKCRALEKSFYVGNDLIEAARFFKKMAFHAVGGFDTNLQAGEDWDISIRLRKAGFNFGRTERLIIHHEGNLSLREAVTKKYQYGKTVNLYERKHPEEARAQLGISRLMLFRNVKKLRERPQYAIGLIMMKACEYLFLGISSRTPTDPNNQSLDRPSQSTVLGIRLPKNRKAT